MPMSSPFWEEDGASYSLISGKMPRRNSIRRVVNRDGFRAFTELFDTLVGATAGSAASASHARVGSTHSNNADNQEAQIVTVVDINRNSTSDDVTTLKEMVFGVIARPSYPADRSGNGGGALA